MHLTIFLGKKAGHRDGERPGRAGRKPLSRTSWNSCALTCSEPGCPPSCHAQLPGQLLTPHPPQHKIQCCPFPDTLPRLHTVISPANPGQVLNHCLPSAELGYYGWDNFLPICKLCEQNLFKIAALTNKQSQLHFHQHLPSSNINICVSVTGDGLWSNHS